MQRYFALNHNLEIDKKDIYHMYKVMRMKTNDNILVVYDKITYLCKIISLDLNNIDIEIISSEESKSNNNVDITIAISLVNEQKWDYILQKATELGVNKIMPVIFERTIIKIDESKILKKLERWMSICKEASEQSHRDNIPNILDITKLNNINSEYYDLKLICSTNKDILSLKQILSKDEKYDKILIVIGPEGGISSNEEDMLENKGFIRVSLGNLILRVETVPLYILSVINYELMR